MYRGRGFGIGFIGLQVLGVQGFRGTFISSAIRTLSTDMGLNPHP